MGQRLSLSAIGIAVSLLVPQPSSGAMYYLDAAQADVATCGTTPANGCRTYAYWYSLGCGGAGCASGVRAGDTIHFAAGTYNERLTIPFVGTAASMVTMQCDGSAGSCVVSGQGLASTPDCGMICVGCGTPSNTSCNKNHQASYVRFAGFTVNHIPNMGGIVGTQGSHHILIDTNYLDAMGITSSGEDLVQFGDGGGSYVTLLNNSLSPCPIAGPSGCIWIQEVDKVALIGNTFGPKNAQCVDPSNCNYDGITFQGVQDSLIDGNIVNGLSDGIDVGMNGDQAHPLLRNIIRYNFIYGQSGQSQGSRAFKHSCEAEDTPPTICGDSSFYKNVITVDASGNFGRGFRDHRGHT